MSKNEKRQSDEKKVFQISWKRIPIEITFSFMLKDIVPQLVHLSIQSEDRIPLPITETGYRSKFLYLDEIDYHGGVIPYVEKWLEKCSQSKKWKQYEAKNLQLMLF